VLRVSLMLSVKYGECRKLGHYAECRYAKCRYVKCRSPECRGAKRTAMLIF
jgi:hypothetical protein